MAWRDIFISDQQRHEEIKAKIAEQMEEQRWRFIAGAVQNGFTDEQAQFMAKYVSLIAHCHEYRNDCWDRFTTPEV